MPRRQRYVPATPPYPGDRVEVRVESIVFGGAGLARLEDGRILFVMYAAPGERVEAEVERVHADYLEGVTRRVIEASADRVEPPCPLFGECGGCQLQHLEYAAQLAVKANIVREQLERIAHLPDPPLRPIVGARNPWGYRNHVRFSTGQREGDLGFVPRGGRGLLRVDHCPIADPWVNELLPRLQGKGRGLHQVQVRHNAALGSYLIAPTIPGMEHETGQKAYLERLGGRDFVVSASAFFQVNAEQAEEMARLVGEALPERGELLIDAFAGVGTFAILFAERFRRVIAIEESASATKDALENAKQAPNVEVRVGKVEEILPALGVRPDALLLDPPRAGCMPAVLEAIGRDRPPVVVYVSCNPATFARDVRILGEHGYTLDHVTPLDMFPQTGHIECVARLSAG